MVWELPLIFNKDITVTQESVEFKVYPKNPDASSFKLLSNEINELPTPVRPDFDFKGWYVEDKLITKAKDIKLKSGDTMTTLTAHWESYSLKTHFTQEPVYTTLNLMQVVHLQLQQFQNLYQYLITMVYQTLN